MRVILDTSVIVSGLISPNGAPAQVIARWLNNEFTLLDTTAMFAELEDVLNRAWLSVRLQSVPNRISDFLAAVSLLGEQVVGYVNVTGHVRDPFDEMFLRCARLGVADYIVTGDKDLLALGSYAQTKIVTPVTFLAVLT